MSKSHNFLFVLFFVSLSTGLLYSQTAIAPTAGIGTSTNPYQIASLENLYWIAENPLTWISSHFIQTADINAAETRNWFSDSGWTPIGNESRKFNGVYNGKGYRIDSLVIFRPKTDYIGLFGYIYSGSIDSLGLNCVNVKGRNYVGGLVGHNSGTVHNCYSTGDVSDSMYVGGLVGANFPPGQIINCYTTGNVIGLDDFAGGLVGYNSGTISICHSNDTVFNAVIIDMRSNCNGGLVGYNISPGKVINCYSNAMVYGLGESVGGAVGKDEGGEISNCYFTGKVTGNDDFVGGIVGYSHNGKVSSCYCTGTVTGNYDFVGGIAGAISGDSGKVRNCYNLGTVTGTPYHAAGGLVGEIGYGPIGLSEVINSYSAGKVIGGYPGGIVGYNLGVIKSSFWDSVTSGPAISKGAVGKSTAEMKTASTFKNAGWDFMNDSTDGTGDYWEIDATYNSGYPFLKWQKYKLKQAITISLPDSATYSSVPISLNVSSSSGIPVYCTSSDTSVAVITDNTIIIKRAGVTTITAIVDSLYIFNADTVTHILKICKKPITITGITASDKVYDGTTGASLSGGTLNGVQMGDTISLIAGIGFFTDKNTGNGKTIIMSRYEISGADATNYLLLSQPSGVTANITYATLTIRAKDIYKSQFQPDPKFTVTYSGFVTGDDPSVVRWLTITRAPGEAQGTYAIIPSGATASNYKITFINGTFTIEQPVAIKNITNKNDNKNDNFKTGIFIKSNPVSLSSKNSEFIIVTPFSSDIWVMIYDAVGNIIYDKNTFITAGGEKATINWDLRKKNGVSVGVGTYLIAAHVKKRFSGESIIYKAKLGVKD